MSRVELSWTTNFDDILAEHFAPLRDPTDGARQRENYSEHVPRNFQSLQHDTRIEVNIRIKLSLLEIFIIEGRFF